MIVSILVAGTVLLSNSANVPWWWFHFSFIMLIALTFFIPTVIFFKPISERVKKWKLKRKRNAIAQTHFSEFKDLVETCKRFKSPINSIFNNLRSSHDSLESPLITYILKSYNEDKVNSIFYHIEKEIDDSNKTFGDLYFIMKHLESVLNVYERNLKIMEEFVHERRDVKGKKISKDIEKEFESFREKYNYFVKDFKGFCKKVNEEIGEREFPEWALKHVEKW